jgi:hypothetical protein
MYALITHLLFYLYWAIALATVGLLLRALFQSRDWKVQASAALALIPFLLRVLFIK